MKQLHLLLNELESKIEFREYSNKSVSYSDVSWHLDHSLKVINSVITVLKKSDPKNYKWTLHLKRSYLFFINFIPRGKAKSPDSVRSYNLITIKDLHRQLETARFLVSQIDSLDNHTNVKHPFIGLLNLKQAIKFLEIHTRHHLKIITEIISENNI